MRIEFVPSQADEQRQACLLYTSSDLPLAAEVIEKGGHVLSHRGEWFSAANIRPLLNMRDFMDNLRASGVQTGGPPPMSQSERQAFAAHLDRFLASHT